MQTAGSESYLHDVEPIHQAFERTESLLSCPRLREYLEGIDRLEKSQYVPHGKFLAEPVGNDN